jgi:hypothetical protein
MSSAPKPTPFRAVICRLMWMLFGPLMLFVATRSLFKTRAGLWNLSDLGYFGCLVPIVFGRWIEVQSGLGLTADGEPVTAHQVRRFTVAAVAIGLAVWASATVLRTFTLTG